MAIEKRTGTGYPVAHQRSKRWDGCAWAEAPIVTVWDNAAGEVCPVWPGCPARARWSFENPTAVARKDAQKRAAIQKFTRHLAARFNRFVALPNEKMTRRAVHNAMQKIGGAPVISA